MIFLEDLASHFGLRTQDAIEKVQLLLKEGRLTGSYYLVGSKPE